VPLRLAIGPRDLAAGVVEMNAGSRRIPRRRNPVPLASLATSIRAFSTRSSARCFERAVALRASKTFVVDSYDEFKAKIESGGFFHMRWCASAACEAKVQGRDQGDDPLRPFDGKVDAGPCVVCGTATDSKRAVFARSY